VRSLCEETAKIRRGVASLGETVPVNAVWDPVGPLVLVVEDELEIAALMRDFLEAQGFRVVLAPDAEDAAGKLLAAPDCVVLDVMLPGASGFDLCREIRASSEVPVLFLSARDDDAEPRGWISRYAWGDDYHQVLQEKLGELMAALREHFDQPFESRVYADTGPINERVFAKYAGLGWLGKNTLLLNQHLGSWLFLGAILTTLDLTPTLQDGLLPPPDLCGNCRRCLDACPTHAFVEPYVMDARRCISYLTIELRSAIPDELREPIGTHVFGCDICQDVCPWNRRAPITPHQEFRPRNLLSTPENYQPEDQAENSGSSLTQQEPLNSTEESLFLPKLEWLAALDESDFRRTFRASAVKRTKWRGLVRNTCIALGNSELHHGTAAHHRICELLDRLSTSHDALIAESALWALSRIQ
jgi:epoxyqueuosine reductase